MAMRLRRVGGIAVIGLGPNAAGEIIPPDVGLARAWEGSRGAVIDLAGCDLVSSEIIGFIVRAQQVMSKSQNRLRVCCPDGPMREALTLVSLDRLFPTFGTLDGALDDIEPPAK